MAWVPRKQPCYRPLVSHPPLPSTTYARYRLEIAKVSAIRTKKDFQPIFGAITRATGLNFDIKVGQSYSAVVEAMCNGAADIAWYGPASYLQAKARGCAELSLYYWCALSPWALFSNWRRVPARGSLANCPARWHHECANDHEGDSTVGV